jgi:hypothetical protein
MTNHVDRFHAALTVLAGHGHVKQRLMRAYEDNLVEIMDDELPVAVQQSFSDLRSRLHSVAPLNGEGPVCASVRKMSFDEASSCAEAVVSLFVDVIRMSDESPVSMPMADATNEPRIPPFLVKTV